MFLNHHSRLPITFDNYFVTSAAVHNYSTRSYNSLKYYIPKYRLARLQSFKYVGVKIWNDIDLYTVHIKLLSFNKFKENYKWDLVPSPNCECGASEQTADYVLTACPIHRASHGARDLTILDDETRCWFNNTTASI